MKCESYDGVKPLDRLFDDQIKEFESGGDRECDRELDVMIWELGGYENEEPPQEAAEYAEERPVEEELVEKKIVRRKNGRSSFVEGKSLEGDLLPSDETVLAHAISPESRKARSPSVRSNSRRKDKR